MTDPALPLASLPPLLRWGVLALLTAAIVTPLELVNLPAAFMLGGLIAGIVTQICGAGVRVPRQASIGAEALLGCMIAGAITPIALRTFLSHAPLFLSIVAAILVASTFIGWLLLRLRSLPGTTAIWGLSPGAANAILLMAGPYGADERLVAFMQYTRILMVASIAPIIAHFWADPAVAAHGSSSGSALDWAAFATSLCVAAIGIAIQRKIKIPAGTMLVPMIIGGVLHATGLIQIELPGWLMAAAYIVLGWGIGLNFTMAVLRHAFRTLPQVLGAMIVLICFCGGLAALLWQVDGVDPLTAYLATSPGGLSSVAIIAATSRVDLAFVIGLQT
ncbi:AbrB family transcriptional regulator, partial [Thioclava sp. BHET1]